MKNSPQPNTVNARCPRRNGGRHNIVRVHYGENWAGYFCTACQRRLSTWPRDFTPSDVTLEEG